MNVSSSNTNKQITQLFFDGQCPLCSKEIAFLKRYSKPEELGFIDIHKADKQILSTHGKQALPNKAQLLRVLHLLDHRQGWVKGVDASVLAWSFTPFGWLLKPLRWPLISPIVDRIYTRWADRRYQRHYACGACMGAEE